MMALLGIVSGAVCAFGSVHNPDPIRLVTASVVLTVALGSLCASFLNAANNAINQIYDLEIDRVNKPSRPLVTGELSMREAWAFTWICYVLALVPTWLVVVYPHNRWAEKLMAPDSGFRMPAMPRNSVDLPAPFGPTTASSAPEPTSPSRWCTAGWRS